MELPLFLSPVASGFPSPAQDYTEQTIDFNQLCVAHPAATYFVRAAGDSMVDHGIRDGDLLVVDRSRKARHGSVVSRSVEAKALGIKMGVPHFQIRQCFEAMGGVWFSSNYALSGDMSNRVMTTLEGMASAVK